jgi:hypothetical protein
MIRKTALIIGIILTCSSFIPAGYSVKIARLKYGGGGNWYVSPTALPNLVKFCNQNLGTSINPEEGLVEPGSPDVFNYPWIHMTGNGRFVFNAQEAQNMRNYLIGGGFLNINDSYDMDRFVRPELKKVFPELDLVEIPFSHPIYHQKYEFPNGLPKIHEHNEKPPQGFGLFWQGRMVCFYNYESDIGDGWEDADVHHDSDESRNKALKMGANIIQYVFNN